MEVEELYKGKAEGSRSALIGGCWPGEAGGDELEPECLLYDWLREYI